MARFAQLRAPVAVAEFDLGAPTRIRVVSSVPAMEASVFVRAHGEPIGTVYADVCDGGLDVDVVRATVVDQLSMDVRKVLGVDLATESGWLEAAKPSDFAKAHAAYVTGSERIAAIVCTRERPNALKRCLESLTDQDHPNSSVWVVDNAPKTTATREVADEFRDRLDLKYLQASLPGLSRARNVALAADIDADVVAWIDDDEIADSFWLSEISRNFAERPDATAVSGLVLPAELLTEPQVWFEQYGGHSKGRGYTPAEFSPATRRNQHPLFPLPSFGSGANMAFRISALREMNGFDEALGAGTLTMGAEDTKIFSELLMNGGTVLYRPSAITRHFHRRDQDALKEQMIGYGIGLTAFYSALVISHPNYFGQLARLAWPGIRELTSREGVREATIGPDFPRCYLNAHRKALLRGPDRYVRQRWINFRERRQSMVGVPDSG
jgi:glycosyltransferase involved in cell wall biosynthesis